MTINSRLPRRFAFAGLSFALLCLAQKDPGVRGGPPGAGGPIQGFKPTNWRCSSRERRARSSSSRFATTATT